MSERTYYAHTPDPSGNWHGLDDHLKGVAQKAAIFASRFSAREEARMAGFLHDLGKFRNEFQSYIRGEREGGTDTHHAVYGAAFAMHRDWPCAFVIAGHHAGLHDRGKLQSLVDDPKYKADDQLPCLTKHLIDFAGEIPRDISFPPFLSNENPWSVEFYIRMLFSCLVDADFLDTEEHFAEKARQVIHLSDIAENLLGLIIQEKASKPVDGTVNQIRHGIFEQCISEAEKDSGFFSLTVPTGGGKTLSAMAFALAHARKWKKDRIIVIIPYLSIIEQNAAEYRRILDPNNEGVVIEHHSAVSESEDATKDDEARERSSLELAAENWDAPVMITTSVQFIESLFASSPSKCRKLHNIANSVVILDEVQLLPTHLLTPLLNVLRELRQNYSVTFVLSTATQPAFHSSASLPEGFQHDEVIEITRNTNRTFEVLKRVKYERLDALSWEVIVERMAGVSQVLCVVNVRKHAHKLWQILRSALPTEDQESVFHLSSAMCAEHRLYVLGEIKSPREGSIRHRLKHGMPCRVVSTQVVEAGVDLDFPTVLRALGPLDSIVQAAGRCNREGRLVDDQGQLVHGQVTIFTPPEQSIPSGVYKTATAKTAVFLENVSLNSLGTDCRLFGEYFSQLVQLVDTDPKHGRESTIQEDRSELRYREVSRKARVIDDEGRPIVVPYGYGKALVNIIRERDVLKGQFRFDRSDLRKLQRYMVNVRTRDFQKLQHLKMVSQLLPNLDVFVLEEGCYHEHLGLLIDNRPLEDFVQ